VIFAALRAAWMCQHGVSGRVRIRRSSGVFWRVAVQKKTGQEFAGPARHDSLRAAEATPRQISTARWLPARMVQIPPPQPIQSERAARDQAAALWDSWLRGRDLNPRPLGYEPNELPDCSTPRQSLCPTPRPPTTRAIRPGNGRRVDKAQMTWARSRITAG
jgi:hypothetical protein